MVTVPAGVEAGQSFLASVGGELMSITCPPGCGGGSAVHVRGPRLGDGAGAARSRSAAAPSQRWGLDAGLPEAGADEDELMGITPRTRQVLQASKREAAALEALGSLFPGLSQGELRAVLERHEWEVNAACCELMDMGLQL